jgi:hypothetical protein
MLALVNNQGFSIETPRYDVQAPWMSMPPKIDNGYS